jgi:hypothetical protein
MSNKVRDLVRNRFYVEVAREAKCRGERAHDASILAKGNAKKTPLGAAAEERVRTGPPERLGPGEKNRCLGFARRRWVRSFKNLLSSFIQGLRQGITILWYG